MSGGQNYLLPVIDMAKVGGLLSVVKVFAQIWTFQVHSPLLFVFRLFCRFLIWPEINSFFGDINN